MSGPFRELLGLDQNGETTNPSITPEQRAAKARALQQVGVTQTPKPAAPASTSDGQGFWDQLKTGAAQNTEKFLNFVNNKPMPEEAPAPTTLAGKAGRFVAGAADPINLIGFGGTSAALDAIGVPGMIEKGAAKLAGESLMSKIAAKTVAASAEGAVVGGAGSPPTDYLRSIEEGKPYDPSTAPGSMLQGAAMGAVLDPFMRGISHIPELAKAGAQNMVSGGISSYAHEIPEHATWENYDPWDAHQPTQSVPGAGQVNSGLAGAYEPGKLFVQGALKKFGDKMDVGVPTDDSGRNGVAVDLYKSGTKDDPTLSVGFLRHNENAPTVELNNPTRPDNVQPEPTPRETMAILQHIQRFLTEDPAGQKIKWLDTDPVNSNVAKFLAKRGGQWEDGGKRMVVPADNIRQNLKTEPSPEMLQSIQARSEFHGNNIDDAQFHPDPFGRVERAIRKGHDPDAKFYSPTWEGRNDTASGANPRDPDTGLLAYSGVPVPEIVKAGKGFAEGVKGKLEDKLDGEAPETTEDPVINVAKLPIDNDAKVRLANAAEKLRDLKNSGKTTVESQVNEAARLAIEVRKNYNGNEQLDMEKAKKLSGVELRARTEANMQINQEIEDLGKTLDTTPDRDAQDKIQAQIDQLHETQTRLLSESVVGEGEKGRDLRALRYAPDSLVGWLKKAQREAGPGNKIPEDVDTAIRAAVTKRKGAKTPKEEADADEELESIIEKLKQRPLWDHVNDLYKTLLTLPGATDTGIIAANVSAYAADHVNRAVATVADQMLSLFTGARSMTYRGAEGALKYGIPSAAENIKENFRSGKTALADTQFGKPVGEKYGLLQKLVSKVPGEHLELAKKAMKADDITKVYLKMHWARLGAEHMAFRDVLIAQNLVAEAHVKAINEGLQGEARNTRVSEILKNLSEHPTITARAIEDAVRAVYVKDNQFSKMVNSARQTAPRGVKQVLDLAMPFTKIAANVAEAGLDYSPVIGLLKEATAKNASQHSIVLAIGRQATGAGLLAVAYALHKQGILTGAGPKTTPEKQQWESEGRAPYSVLVNGTWRSYERVLGPLSWPVGLGSDVSDFVDNISKQGPHTELMDKVNNLISGPAEHLADEVPGGAMTAFSSFKTADPGENFLENAAVQTLTPGLLANAAKGLDNKERATDTFADKLKARVPGLRQSLPAKVDATGREIPTVDNALGTMLDPTHPHEAVNDPALNELSRLGLNLAKPGSTGTYTPVEQAARRQQGVTQNMLPERYDRSPEDVRNISQETIGGRRIIDYLNDRVADPAWPALPDEIKRAVLSDLIGKLRAGSTATYEFAHPQPVKPLITWP